MSLLHPMNKYTCLSCYKVSVVQNTADTVKMKCCKGDEAVEHKKGAHLKPTPQAPSQAPATQPPATNPSTSKPAETNKPVTK